MTNFFRVFLASPGDYQRSETRCPVSLTRSMALLPRLSSGGWMPFAGRRTLLPMPAVLSK